MQYFVTFTLLRTQAPQLFISGDSTDGHRLEDRLTFESTSELQQLLTIAGLPLSVLQEDLLSPFLVSADQLRTLGLTIQG